MGGRCGKEEWKGVGEDREKGGWSGRRGREEGEGERRYRREIRTQEEGQSGWERDRKRGRMDVLPMFLRY